MRDITIYLFSQVELGVKDTRLKQYYAFVARQGFEPQLPGPKPGVLPLDDLADDT